MKQSEIIKVYKALETLADNKNFSGKDQWSIYKLRKELRSHSEFQKEREDQIVQKYIPFADEQGVLTGEHYSGYVSEMNELNNLEVEINIEKIELPFVDGLTFKDVEPLEDFIEFKNPE